MGFPIKVPFHISTHLKKFTATSGINYKSKAYGIGVVNGKVYVNLGSGASLLADALSASATNAGAAASNGGTVTAVEYGLGGFLHKTVLTLTAMPLTLADATVGAGTKIYDFPQGATLIQAASGVVAETTTSAILTTLNGGITYNWGVGTTTQANGTLATTEQDIIPTTNGVSSTVINVAAASSKGTRVAAPANFDGHTTAKDAFFNVGIAAAGDIDADATTTWTGTISIIWSVDVASV